MLETKRTMSMSSNSASISDSIDLRPKIVRFHPDVKVALLPWQEREEARKARAGSWKPAPMSDELWDGELLVFRKIELTPEAFKAMSAPEKRRKTPMPRSFASMFSSSQATTTDGKLAGVDIVHARARVYAEDFDEEDRDSNGRLETSSGVEETEPMTEPQPLIVYKMSAERLGNEIVIRFQETPASAAPPLPPSSTKRRSTDKLTRFSPTPPSEPSPSEKAGLISAVTLDPQLLRKKSSNASNVFTTAQGFTCGDGKRPTLYIGEEPIKDEREEWDCVPIEYEAPQQQQQRRRNKSLLGRLIGAITLSA